MIEEKEIWVVVDALDECTTRKGPKTEGLLAWVKSLLNHTQSNVHMLVTSRPEEDIHSAFRSMELDDYMISIQNDVVDEDICAYVQARVREGDGLRRWRQHTDVQAEIETTIMQKANGMFRWAACQVDVLETCLDYLELSDALTSLPKTLDETYNRILEAIPREQKQTAMRILQFLVYSERPLTILELVDAIAVREVEPYFVPKHRMPEPREITRYCSSLVVMVPGDGAIDDDSQLQSAHFSVQEYLTSNRLDQNYLQYFQEAYARKRIAIVCLAYLLHFEKELSPEDTKEQFPFAQYSSQFWMTHARFCNVNQGQLLDLMEQLFCHNQISYNICFSLFHPYDWLRSREGGHPAPPLYQAVIGRLEAGVRILIGKGAEINFCNKYFDSPLYVAAYLGHEEMVRLLLDHNANVNYLGGREGSALQAAAGQGHEKVVKLLIERGGDVNIQSNAHTHALTGASYVGHLPVVRILLENGANIHAEHRIMGNAIRAASYRG